MRIVLIDDCGNRTDRCGDDTVECLVQLALATNSVGEMPVLTALALTVRAYLELTEVGIPPDDLDAVRESRYGPPTEPTRAMVEAVSRTISLPRTTNGLQAPKAEE